MSGARDASSHGPERGERHERRARGAELDAERAALAADQSVLEATGELDRAFIALQKAMGLGWSQQ